MLGIRNVPLKMFRRWFKAESSRNGMHVEIINRMMGHKGEISASYELRFADIDEFVEEYVENIESATLLGNRLEIEILLIHLYFLM